jgi:ATP-dependent Lon protease
MKLIIFQRLVRLKLLAIKNINKDIQYLDRLFIQITKQLEYIFSINLISYHKYSLHLQTLENILLKFNNLPNIYTLKHKLSIKEIRNKIDYLNDKLIGLCGLCGLNNIFELIQLNLKFTKLFFKHNSLLCFLESIVRPLNFKIYDNIINKETNLIVYSDSNSLEKFDSDNLNKTDITFKLMFKADNITEITQGARIYIPIITNNKNITIVIDVIFEKDSLNIYRKNRPFLKKKVNKLKKLLNEVNINKSFKLGYLEQLSLRDLVVYNTNDIIKILYKSFNKVNDLKNNTISSLIKTFLSVNTEEQHTILTLLLLLKDDIDTQYLAYMMYDMISNESNLLKPQALSEEIYNSLHWSIQKLFKITIKNIDKYNKTLLNFNESDIPYEKRIALLKVNDYVKSKAMEKYKEIMNKGGENSNKSHQYLDGLLNIPFGIFKKEKILLKLSLFRNDIQICFKELLNSKILNTQNTDLINNYNLESIKCKEIDIILDKILKILYNNLINIFNQEIESIYEHRKKITYNTLKNNVENINNILLTNSLDKIEIKKKKKDLFDLVFKIIKKIDIFDIKIKLLNILNTDFSNIINNNSNLVYYNKVLTISNNWNNNKTESKNYLINVKNILNEAVYGQEVAKNEILRIIAQWMNGETKGYCIGFEGPPGTGKTSLAKKGISKCLVDDNGNSRPFAFIPLGGSSNGSILEGHSYTYVGSTWGKIVDVLMETKCMNPIIYIDELDKISKTENGREIIGILTHLTDSTQNDEFYDKYFSGIKIDLSKVLFIFSYNNFGLIDPILADRIHRVKFTNLTNKEKIFIINNYLLPELLETVGFPDKSIIFSDEILEYIIYNYTLEGGIRKFKQQIFEIIREVNLKYIMNYETYTFPIMITKEIIEEIFSNKLKIIYKKISPKSHIGLVNGLYATTAGIGGITIIEVFKTFSDTKLSLTLTGQQGEVMKESMQCAKTIAWNLIPDSLKKDINDDWKNNSGWGLHVHCPEAAVPKDGPSAGGAITLAMVSLLTRIPVKNTVALTGEIDLNGTIHAIGGLDNKIEGGKLAGVELILYPQENEQDIEMIKNKHKEILENIEIRSIKNIWEILEYCLEDNSIEFNKYI